MEKIWPKNQKFWNIFWYYWFSCLSLYARQISSKSVKIWLCNNPFLKNASSWDFNFCKFLSLKGHIWMGNYVFPSIIFFTLPTSEAHCVGHSIISWKPALNTNWNEHCSHHSSTLFHFLCSTILDKYCGTYLSYTCFLYYSAVSFRHWKY